MSLIYQGESIRITRKYLQTKYLRQSVPVHRGNNERWYVIFSDILDNVALGSWIDARVRLEFTNNLTYRLSASSRIYLCQNIDETPDHPNSLVFSGGGGDTLEPNAVHKIHTNDDEIEALQVYGSRRVSFAVKASSSAAQSGDAMVLEPNGGRMRINVWQS